MEINMIKIKDHNHPNHHQDHHDIQLSKLQPSPKLALAPPSPPSNASSPTHEFSFTISLHPNSAAAAAAAAATTAVPDKSKPTHDFSPADEIFFQGHLLPLHLLSSHLTPISPRASTNSLDSLPLPINQTAAYVDDGGDIKERTKSKSFSYGHPRRNPPESKDKPIKSKSFSFLGIPKWRTEKKQSNNNNNNNNNNQNQKTKMKFDIGNMVKRYINMIRPLILSLRGKKDKSQILRHPHSFSGNLGGGGGGGGGGSRKGGGVNGRRDISSAPASMRTSPGNSGLLTPALPISSTSDSTMEELQAAIQAAIAHCKNSISMEEKIKVK